MLTAVLVVLATLAGTTVSRARSPKTVNFRD
jgi:hypothetical protein